MHRVVRTKENAGLAVEMRTYYHPIRAGGAGLVAAVMVAAFTVLAFGSVFLAVLAVNMPGVPAGTSSPTTTIIACPAQPVQFACRVSGGQQ